MNTKPKTLIQCDFDNTICADDVSFMLLDAFGDKNWRNLLTQYAEGAITVGRFNALAFGAIKADEQTLHNYIQNSRLTGRPGFKDLLQYCADKGHEFVVVSNGLDFYIRSFLKSIGVNHIKVFAAKTNFNPGGLDVAYIGPDGQVLDAGFKDSYVNLHRSRGYRVVYIGDGSSDVSPASQSHHIFARDELLRRCREKGLTCMPFEDFRDVKKGLERL
jgi:2-hydroxy-3-keto-5-methylthiopentenyl-1-phosphate phosphatase